MKSFLFLALDGAMVDRYWYPDISRYLIYQLPKPIRWYIEVSLSESPTLIPTTSCLKTSWITRFSTSPVNRYHAEVLTSWFGKCFCLRSWAHVEYCRQSHNPPKSMRVLCRMVAGRTLGQKVGIFFYFSWSKYFQEYFIVSKLSLG